MSAYTLVEYNYFQSLAKTFITPATKYKFILENLFFNAPGCRIVFAMKTNSAFIGSSNENPFWYQQFNLRQIRKLRADFDAADNCRLYATTKKARNFQDDISSIPINKLKDHYVLVFDLTLMQDASENCQNPELLGEPLGLELCFNFPLEDVTELIVMEKRMCLVAVHKFGVVGGNKLDNG